jgi:hypothetical protein
MTTEPMTAAERALYAADETGQTEIVFRGSIEVGKGVGPIDVYARTIRFRIRHHEDHHLDFVEHTTEHPDRRCDLLDGLSPAGGTLIATLGEIVDYVHDQASREARSSR